jgi:hypothetical protein
VLRVCKWREVHEPARASNPRKVIASTHAREPANLGLPNITKARGEPASTAVVCVLT